MSKYLSEVKEFLKEHGVTLAIGAAAVVLLIVLF